MKDMIGPAIRNATAAASDLILVVDLEGKVAAPCRWVRRLFRKVQRCAKASVYETCCKQASEEAHSVSPSCEIDEGIENKTHLRSWRGLLSLEHLK
jgi:hypothetical protein